MKIAIGIDVGGTNTKYGVLTENGKLIKKLSTPTDCTNGGRLFMEEIAKTVFHIEEALKGEKYQTAGVGIGMPGPVLTDGRVENCVNLNLQDMYPEAVLTEMLNGISVNVGNDANVAALGELWKGGGKGYDSIVFITLGTGVGGGVVLNNRIANGSKGLAGEIGHIVVNPYETDLCNCGKRGCLDQIASAKGIERMARQMLEFTDAASVLRDTKRLSAKSIVDAAREGDTLAYMILDYCMSFLGKCLADVSYVIDPQVFVIGGGVSQGGRILTDMIQRHYQKEATLVKKKTPVLLAKLGNDAGIYGAAKMVFDRLEHR
ncbi:ROK family glucokinase [Muricomes sp. OA1]|uniref:Glucokinase n=2 Tax=Lachnospiraceae TaxID=186803 RepID=A0A3E2X2E9_9FIRM|nr:MULTISPECIES: ROK family glucokinase [Clostridia]MEE0201600.1 ROK family glucokinase [Muricomes sp.]MCH1971210.1 ROK family glucokinase [Muricomes sp. OA1]MRM88613.1 ROK family protein [Faecalicatena contorta]RGC34986.1 ROK family protein [Hungatella hathewayi]GKH34508.1 glucokinase [Faecalicatena contorta]